MRAAGGLAVAALLLMLEGLPSSAAPRRFTKVSEHCYVLEAEPGWGNVGAVISDDGVLLIDTPPAGEIPPMLEALKRVTTKSVRWVVNTHQHEDHTRGNAYFLEHNATIIGGPEFRRVDEKPAEGENKEQKSKPTSAGTQLIFGRQVRLFPGGVEVRIFASEHRAHTNRDVVVWLPSEKVLHVGDLFLPGSYPAIDVSEGQGSAIGWLEAMGQVIESVPVLKSAMPPPKANPSKPPPSKPPPPKAPPSKAPLDPSQVPLEEKTLEEQVIVIPGHGPVSNLQEMKDLFETSRKLRLEAGRAAAARRSRDGFLASPGMAPFRVYGNFEGFAAQLYAEAAGSKKQ
jgi:glyoxylase-like metal-dependent hydrolase (beta-lactamase superfamily II)